MNFRRVVGMTALVLAVGALGCTSDDIEITDHSNELVVDPLFYGIDEGLPAVQFSATVGGDPAAVTWESSAPTVATVSPTGLVTPLNDGFAAITATLVANTAKKKSASMTVNALFGTPLTSGVAVNGIGGAVGNMSLLYRIYVPAGKTNLTVTMSGGTGDFDLYVRKGPNIPNYSDFDCRPYLGGNNESCSIPNPSSGTWYVWIDVYDAGAGVSLVATVTP